MQHRYDYPAISPQLCSVYSCDQHRQRLALVRHGGLQPTPRVTNSERLHLGSLSKKWLQTIASNLLIVLMEPVELIIDTDPGIDDALAILLALGHVNVKVAAITTGESIQLISSPLFSAHFIQFMEMEMFVCAL